MTCEAEWNGGSNKDDVTIIFEDEENSPVGTKKLGPSRKLISEVAF